VEEIKNRVITSDYKQPPKEEKIVVEVEKKKRTVSEKQLETLRKAREKRMKKL